MYSDDQFSVENISGEILFSGKITRSHRHQLRSVLLTEFLSPGDHILIDRLFYGVRKGLVKIED